MRRPGSFSLQAIEDPGHLIETLVTGDSASCTR
jgi:hypothetical protein